MSFESGGQLSATPSGMQKTLAGWRHENKFSFLHLTRVFLNNLRMFNIYQPDLKRGAFRH